VSTGGCSLLDDISILDMTEGRGQYAGKFLADLGADVVKIESPWGSKARKTGPFKDDLPGLENSIYFIYYNTNKRGITLNLDTAVGRDLFKQLIRRADVLIEDSEPGFMESIGLDYSVLCRINQQIIMASITGFGHTGPYSDYQAPDIVSFAAGGLMFISGAENEPPVVAPCEQAYHASSLMAAFGIISALYLRFRTGKGQFLDISTHEVLASFSQGIMRYAVTSGTGGRTGSQFFAAPARVYPCKDGYVHLLVFYPGHWRSFIDMIGNPEILSDQAWYDATFRAKNRDLIDPITIEFTLKHTRAEITSLCQSRGIPCTPVNTPADICDDPHFTAREFIMEIEHPVAGMHSYFAPAPKFTESPAVTRRPAPLLGQHNQEIYGELGYSDQDLIKFRAEGII